MLHPSAFVTSVISPRPDTDVEFYPLLLAEPADQFDVLFSRLYPLLAVKFVGVRDGFFGADGSNPSVLCLPAGGSLRPTSQKTLDEHMHFISMNGKEVFKMAVRLMAKSVTTLLERNHLTKDDIACLIPHQANRRIIQSLGQLLNVPMERIFVNLDKTGNTSAASIPMAFAQAKEAGVIKKGDYVMLAAFGGGLTWGATLIKY